MNISGITWRGGPVDDAEILRELPPELVRILIDTNGFILHDGALHVRGASSTPEWHSLRAALQGPSALHTLYEGVYATDIPFAQDQVGDQFLLRGGRVLRRSSETGDIEPLAESLDEFFRHVATDIKGAQRRPLHGFVSRQPRCTC
ncbi:MAG: SMI1/KNR4 family protein [Planctomycetales bacterium]